MIDYLLSADDTFTNLSLLIDSDGIISQKDPLENNFKTALFAENPIELRILYESHLRDTDYNSSTPPYIIVYHRSDEAIPYDIEKKCQYTSISLSSLFPLLDADIIRGLSTRRYKLLLEKYRRLTTTTQPLSREGTTTFVIQALFGTDITHVQEIEQCIRLLIDIHLTGKPLSPALVDQFLSFFDDRFFPHSQLRGLLSDSSAFFAWLSEQLEEFLHTLPDPYSRTGNKINFSHDDLSMKIYHLIANGNMPKPLLPEKLLDAELDPTDQWVLLLSPHTSHSTQEKDSSADQDDPEITDQLDKLKSLADVDQESFLMKTRKTMESIVNDLLSNSGPEVSSYTLFEKLKYLEDHNRLPKTTATFFHTIRKLGNLGAHEAREIRLSDSEIDTILSMLAYVMRWHKHS
jgi:hypothetical protein